MKTKSRQITILILSAALVSLFFSSCRNTAHGFGQDVERVGSNIEESTH